MTAATGKQTTMVSKAVLLCFVSKGDVSVLRWRGGTFMSFFHLPCSSDKITQRKVEVGACLKGKLIPTHRLALSVNQWHRVFLC